MTWMKKRKRKKRRARGAKTAITSTRKKSTKKKTRSSTACCLASLPVYPAIEFKEILHMKRSWWFACACVAVLLIAPMRNAAAAQDPGPPAPTTGTKESGSKAGTPNKKKYSHANDFLIHGTVFNEKALSFPGVELRFRAAGKKKYQWDTHTNSRGEFAVRVPQGSNYEILVRVKGFADQTRTVDAKSGGN